MDVFAKKCDECGKGTNSGYYADGAIYCDSKCLDKHITPEEWDALYEEGGDDYYYTEWDVADSDEQYDAEGHGPPGSALPGDHPCSTFLWAAGHRMPGLLEGPTA